MSLTVTMLNQTKVFLRKILLLFFVLFSVSLTASAQQNSTPVNGVGTFGYEGYHPFVEGRPWGVLLEGYIVRDKIVAERNGYFLRLGLNYDLKGGSRITGGYAAQYSEPIDSASDPYSFPEHRIWQQFFWKRKFGEGKRHQFNQRFRMEQRWTGRKTAPAYDGVTAWRFENTFRYQPRIVTPITKKIALHLNDEISVRLPRPDGRKFLDSNQAYAGLIFYLDEKRLWKLETGYTLQTVFKSATGTDGLRRINHGFSVVIKSDAPFHKKL